MFGAIKYFRDKKKKTSDYELDENGRALIEIGVTDKSHVVAPFHYKKNETISSDFADLLTNMVQVSPPSQPIHIRIDCPNLTDAEKQTYATSIKTYYSNKVQEMDWKLEAYYKSFFVCFLMSLLFCGLWIMAVELGAYWFISELIEIIVWMFVLECADVMIFRRRLVTVDKKQYYSIVTSKISFVKEGGNMYQIAIDGHSGSGKSAFAKGIAKELGFYHLNTGDIYRAMACAYKERGYSEVTEENVSQFIEKLKIDVVFEEGKQVVYIDEKQYTTQLRTEEISALSSMISPYKNLRAKVLQVQRDFASKNNVVMEGRDIGSTILPNANVKIFLTADVKVRAERRYKELPAEEKKKTSLEEVMEDLKERDYRDEHREVAPLCVAQGAVVLDNSNINLEQTIAKGLEIVREKIKI